LLHGSRPDRKRRPLHPLEKAVVAAVTLHLCFLPWALGTMHAWSQVTSLVLAALGFMLALSPRIYSGDLALPLSGLPGARSRINNPQPSASSTHSQASGHTAAMRLTMWPRLVKFPLFWAGLALLGCIAIQGFNPSWVWERNATTWWLRRVNDIPWLPTGVETPFARFNLWRQFIIYASAWLTVCAVWTGFTRRRSLQILLFTLVINAVLLAIVGFVLRILAPGSFLGLYDWPGGSSAFASFIYKNHAGAYFALLTVLAVSLASWTNVQGERAGRKSTPAGLLLFAAVVLTAAVLFTLSRGASLILTAAWLALALWFWLYRRRQSASRSSNSMVQLAVALLFLVGIGYTAREVDFSSIQARFDSLLKNYRQPYESVQSRIQAHSAAESMLADHWQRGVGAGGFRYLFPEYIKKYPEIYSGGGLFWEHAHSDWREIPIELGAAGALLLLFVGGYWLIFFCRRHAFRHPLALPVLLGCGQTLVHAWFDFPFQCPAILLTWLALVASSARWLELDAPP
jgi:uncharacterized membrane protein